MNRILLVSLVAMLAPAGGAVGDQVARYNFAHAWPSKSTGQKKGPGLIGRSVKAKTHKSNTTVAEWLGQRQRRVRGSSKVGKRAIKQPKGAGST